MYGLSARATYTKFSSHPIPTLLPHFHTTLTPARAPKAPSPACDRPCSCFVVLAAAWSIKLTSHFRFFIHRPSQSRHHTIPKTRTSPCTTPWRQHCSTPPTYISMHCSSTGVISAIVSSLTHPHFTHRRVSVRILTAHSATQMPRMPWLPCHHSSVSWYITVQLAHAFNVRRVQRGRQRPSTAAFSVKSGGFLRRSPQSELAFEDAVRDYPRCCK